ncbi:hypothetical protein Droror1_Dr00003264 [Drosera rotundifolia]
MGVESRSGREEEKETEKNGEEVTTATNQLSGGNPCCPCQRSDLDWRLMMDSGASVEGGAATCVREAVNCRERKGENQEEFGRQATQLEAHVEQMFEELDDADAL